jgi:hypothetical protein
MDCGDFEVNMAAATHLARSFRPARYGGSTALTAYRGYVIGPIVGTV